MALRNLSFLGNDPRNANSAPAVKISAASNGHVAPVMLTLKATNMDTIKKVRFHGCRKASLV